MNCGTGWGQRAESSGRGERRLEILLQGSGIIGQAKQFHATNEADALRVDAQLLQSAIELLQLFLRSNGGRLSRCRFRCFGRSIGFDLRGTHGAWVWIGFGVQEVVVASGSARSLGRCGIFNAEDATLY